MADRVDHDFYPKSNDRKQNIALLDSVLVPPPSVSALSHLERWKILQTYLPRYLVDAYSTRIATSTTSTTTTTSEKEKGTPTVGVRPVSRPSPSPPTATATYEIPHDELIEALQKAPQLVVDETPIERYLLGVCGSTVTTDKDAIKEAATKLALHWKMRKFFFQERAFLPMALTSDDNGFEGALSREDMEWLNTGFVSMLPPTADPIQHRCAVLLDVTKLPPHHKSSPKYDNIKLRVSFYIMYLSSLVPTASTHGIVCMSVLGSTPSPYFSKWGYYCGQAFPIKTIEMHFPFFLSRIQRSTFTTFAISVSRMILTWMSSYMYGSNFYFGYDDESVLKKLVEGAGLNRADVPSWIGGSWGMDKFKEWLKTQMMNEEMKYTAEKYRTESKERAKVTERERSKRRRMDAKFELEKLQEQVEALKDEHECLTKVNETLEKMLQYAKDEVNVLDGIENDAEFGGGLALPERLSMFSDPETEEKLDDDFIPFFAPEDLDLIPEDDTNVINERGAKRKW